jgi:hypothetical protein
MVRALVNKCPLFCDGQSILILHFKSLLLQGMQREMQSDWLLLEIAPRNK